MLLERRALERRLVEFVERGDPALTAAVSPSDDVDTAGPDESDTAGPGEPA